MRNVAHDAGITCGLICYHFASKQGLREACDTYVLDHLRDAICNTGGKRTLPDPESLATLNRTNPVMLRYFARALLDGSPSAATLFDDMVARTEADLKKRRAPLDMLLTDTRARAAAHLAMLLAIGVFHDHMVRVLEADPSAPQTSSRITEALADTVSSIQRR